MGDRRRAGRYRQCRSGPAHPSRSRGAVRTEPVALYARRGADGGRPGPPDGNRRHRQKARSQAADRFYTVFLAAFAGVALVMAAVGIYGVMSFAVAQRTHEIGLRMALGGGKTQVLTQVVREGMTTALAGTALGAIGAGLIGRTLEGTVYGVEPANPITLSVVAATLLLAALVACIV